MFHTNVVHNNVLDIYTLYRCVRARVRFYDVAFLEVCRMRFYGSQGGGEQESEKEKLCFGNCVAIVHTHKYVYTKYCISVRSVV